MDKAVRTLIDLSAVDDQLSGRESLAKDLARALEGRRAGLRKSVSNVFLAVYDARGRTRRRPAIVEVRNGHCGGCHLRLPAQLDSTIRQRQSLYSCPHCGRILYASASRDQR
jgi:predicted  nucleic acid-binding Zn-ribbon protein